MTPDFRTEKLGPHHDRADFLCGEDALDRYFRTHVTQDVRRRVTNAFVATDIASGRVAGFYTLAANGLATPDLPPNLVRNLPRYPSTPVARLGRLAIDVAFQKRGLGRLLLVDALSRVVNAPVATFAVLIDAKHDKAADFYRKRGFIPLPSQPLTLFLPVEQALKLWTPDEA